VKCWLHEIKLHRSDLSDQPSPSWRYRCSNSASLGSWAMIFGSNDRWVPQVPAATVHLHRTTSLNMKSRYFKWALICLMMIWEQNNWRVPTASWRPAGTRKVPFSRSDYRKWDMGLPWHEARDYLASSWRKTIKPCQKDNCKRKAHVDHFLGNSRDRTPLLALERYHIRFTIFCEEVLSA
jgi:hypothetical protein